MTRLKDDASDGASRVSLACTLGSTEMASRREAVRPLFRKVAAVSELDDGYALRFEFAEQTADDLLAFVKVERKCCRFMTFELRFESNEGPIWLSIRGPNPTKAFLREELELRN